MAMYYNGKKVRNLYYNGKCITRLALGKEMTRLVEGDDFVRAVWLKGDGVAYIDTLVKNLTDVHYVDILISVDGISSGNSIFFGRESVAPYYNSQIVLYYVPIRQNISVWTNSEGHEINFGGINGNVTLNFDSNIASTQTDSVAITVRNYNSAFSIFLFANNNNGNAISPFRGKIKKLEIDNTLYLTPCRLLRPIPATLDANGIARNAGDCGMYDSISGKFYGNVASSGTFTVEPSLVEGVDYERHRWLVSEGSAYIDTLINPSFGDELNATFTLSSKPTVLNIYILVAKDNANTVGFLTGGNFYSNGNPQLLIRNKPSATNGYIAWDARSLGTTIKEYYMYMKINNAQIPDTVVKANGVICNYDGIDGDNRISEVPISTYKIGKGYSEQTGLDTVKLKNVSISSKINLIPVRLLRPLPSYLDANGKARAQYECGMLDLKTMKFYGNVASSGTFTVSDN